MAKQRYVNTKFWTDGYISDLDPIEKLLFLYFLTNQQTDISGVYEVPLKTVATDTGIDKEMVVKVLNRFERDGKMKYENGWLVIKNFIKHQAENPKIIKGIEISMTKCPQWCIDYRYSIDSLSHSNSNTNTNTNSNTNTKKGKPFCVEKPEKELEKQENKDVAYIISLFGTYEISEEFGKWYGIKGKKEPIRELLKTKTVDEIENRLKLVKGYNQLPYLSSFDKIYDPVALLRNWTKMEDKGMSIIKSKKIVNVI
jgi:hypothetical protein